MEEKKIFEIINRICPLLLVFTFGGVFGFIYEELFYYVDLGYLVKRGITFGPWIPIYGIGAVLIILTTNHYRRHPSAVFGLSMLVCGMLEFMTGYLLHNMRGVRLWDYSTEIWNWGNIDGYICVRSVLFFGISALFLQYVVYPFILSLQEKCRQTTFSFVSLVPALLFAADILLSLLNGRV